MALSDQSPPPVPMNADQALGMVSFGLMQRLAEEGKMDLPLLETTAGGNADGLRALKQRLELTALAIDTGAPLSTAEVTALLGARPGKERVERGGLLAKRVSRNVWRLSRVEETGNEASGFRQDGFRRRL